MSAAGTIRPHWPLASRSAYWGSAALLGVLRVSAVQSPDPEIEHACEGDPGDKRHKPPHRDAVEPAETIDGAKDHQPLRDDVQEARERVVQIAEHPESAKMRSRRFPFRSP
jgi:hypothetical protein